MKRSILICEIRDSDGEVEHVVFLDTVNECAQWFVDYGISLDETQSIGDNLFRYCRPA